MAKPRSALPLLAIFSRTGHRASRLRQWKRHDRVSAASRNVSSAEGFCLAELSASALAIRGAETIFCPRQAGITAGGVAPSIQRQVRRPVLAVIEVSGPLRLAGPGAAFMVTACGTGRASVVMARAGPGPGRCDPPPTTGMAQPTGPGPGRRVAVGPAWVLARGYPGRPRRPGPGMERRGAAARARGRCGRRRCSGG